MVTKPRIEARSPNKLCGSRREERADNSCPGSANFTLGPGLCLIGDLLLLYLRERGFLEGDIAMTMFGEELPALLLGALEPFLDVCDGDLLAAFLLVLVPIFKLFSS